MAKKSGGGAARGGKRGGKRDRGGGRDNEKIGRKLATGSNALPLSLASHGEMSKFIAVIECIHKC